MAKSTKKLLSLILAVIMVLSLIPAVSAAEETTEETTPAPAYTTNAGGWVEIANASQFNKWFRSGSTLGSEYILANATEPITAKLVLTGDVVMNITGQMGTTSGDLAHNIVIDLNGHTITATHTSRILSAYDGTLTIMNSKNEGGISAKGANNTAVLGNMIYAGDNSTLNLVNVNITRAESANLGKGGGIIGANEGATVNIIDCVLDGGNTGNTTAGGVLYADNATVNFYSGTIKNGFALSGGNVTLIGPAVMNMYGGEICNAAVPAVQFDGTTANAAGSGAGVYISNTAVFNMYGGEIHDNSTAYGYSRGGNVYLFAEGKANNTPVFNMYGGKIYNGDAMLGDNVYAYGSSGSATVNFYGGEIGASKTGSDARNNIYINKATAVCNVYGGTFKYLPTTSGNAVVNTAECATYTEATEENDHIYTHGVAGETVAATCTAPGYTAYSCETCQKTWNAYTGLAAHTPAVKEAVAGTCTEDGLSEGAYCTVCNNDLIPQLTVKGGHAYEATYISPTEMNTAGTHVYTCSVCGDTYQEADTLERDMEFGELEITDDTSTSVANSRGTHIFVRVIGLDPEKTQGFIGVKVYAGEQLLATTVRPADRPLNLKYAPVNIEINRDTGNWDTTWEEGALSADLVPTHFEVYYGNMETVRGIYAFAFTAEDWAAHPGVANGGQHYPMAPVKENEVPQTCETAGSYDLVVYCEQCDLEISRETVEVPAHTPEVIPGVAPTCTETGLTEGSKCSVCGEILVAQEELPVAEHAWNEGVYTDPTTEADGYTTYTCTVCGETKVETDEGSKLPEVVPSLITKQPEAVNAETGAEVQFHVEAEGNIVSYKWEYRKVWKWFNTSMTGYNTDTLTVTATGARNGYDYRCVITFADGTVLTTEPAELTVNTYITDVVGPNDQTVVNGYKGQFTASAQGEAIKYKWQYQRPGDTGWYYTTMEGNNLPTVLIETNTARDGYRYRCEITDVTGNITVYTEPATMRVLSFKSHPVETFAPTTGTVTFSVTTSVDSGFTYQWQYSRDGEKWTNTTLTGYNTDTLTVPAKGKNGYMYRCQLTGSKNSKIESKAATLHVGDPVVITAQPQAVTVAAGEVATFTVEATNAYAYQWQYQRPTGTTWGNTSADGNQTATLNVTTKASNNGYKYRCVVYGLDGVEYITEIATLTIG